MTKSIIASYLIANWKSNLTVSDGLEWFDTFLTDLPVTSRVKTVVCAPYPLLYPLKKIIERREADVALGAQDLSAYEPGSYTGEVTAEMLEGLVEYVLVGHSERREYFDEDNTSVSKKVARARAHGLKPILCASNPAEVPEIVRDDEQVLVMYEPSSSISKEGKYQEVSEREIGETVRDWQDTLGNSRVYLYGGSVNLDNIEAVLRDGNVAGVVVGHASLDPVTFKTLLEQMLAFQ